MRKRLYGRYVGRDRERERDRGGRDRDRSRDRSPRRKRSRDRGDDGEDDRVNAKGMSDDARRAMFASWNEEEDK